ncbi:class I SAM-dependent methyltransferase [Jannaschia rubra]|uniref:class I SAM-dependent methyltransferase n=1 Tax=Jannaschia rubra TaxID=282197 RepID=UPI00249367A3|nr:class I SAM-dependent methyltransferase [Jannaschia rubra]
MSDGRPVSPYLAPGFYDRALSQGRHRDIVGGRWDETGRAQMDVLRAAGLRPDHRLLDVGAGALRLGCRAVPWLDPGNYWATDASGALMRRGREVELADPARLPVEQLIEDAEFAYPGVTPRIDVAIAFAVFTHLPHDRLAAALGRARVRFPGLRAFLFTVFLVPEDRFAGAFRQADGVVTHPARPPWHMTEAVLRALTEAAGFGMDLRDTVLPRGQRLVEARPK